MYFYHNCTCISGEGRERRNSAVIINFQQSDLKWKLNGEVVAVHIYLKFQNVGEILLRNFTLNVCIEDCVCVIYIDLRNHILLEHNKSTLIDYASLFSVQKSNTSCKVLGMWKVNGPLSWKFFHLLNIVVNTRGLLLFTVDSVT